MGFDWPLIALKLSKGRYAYTTAGQGEVTPIRKCIYILLLNFTVRFELSPMCLLVQKYAKKRVLRPAHTTPENFENGFFTLKTHQMFSVRTTPEEFENAIITRLIGFALKENSSKGLTWLIIKITISSLVIGLKMSYFPLIRLPSCYRTVCYWIVCYWTVCYWTV